MNKDVGSGQPIESKSFYYWSEKEWGRLFRASISPNSRKDLITYIIGQKIHSGLDSDFIAEYLKFLSLIISQYQRNYQIRTQIVNKNNTIPSSYFLLFKRFFQPRSSYFSIDQLAVITEQERIRETTCIADLIDHLWWYQPQGRDSNYADVPFSEAFGGVRRCLQFLKTPQEIFHHYFKLARIAEPKCIKHILSTSLQLVIPFFSYLKTFFHACADVLPPSYYLYMELDTIAGYPKQEYRKMGDDPVEWLEILNTDTHDSNWWCSKIKEILYQYSRPSQEPLLSFTDFVRSRWLWVTDGACPNSKLYLDDVKVKTKFGAAVSLSDQELFNSVFYSIKDGTDNLTIFEKPDEKGFKRRLIANMDLGSYLIAAYIRYLLQWIDGAQPAWMAATVSLQVDLDVISHIRTQDTAIPLDESQFDHHVTRDSWLGFIAALKEIFPQNAGVLLFERLFDTTRFKWEGSFHKWNKGMPSGLALTAIGNTLFNFIKQQAIESQVHLALGDDALMFNNDVTLKQIADYYATFGSEVNHLKNWTSQHYGEYLHFLYFNRGRTGYPARMYGSLMYGLKFTDTSPQQRLNELANQWKDFFDRASLLINENVVTADLSRAVSNSLHGFSAAIARRWLHAPRVVNGFGLIPYNMEKFTFKNEEVRRSYYFGNLLRLPPRVSAGKQSFQITPFKPKWNVLPRRGPPMALSKIETLQDWEKRLNLEDMTSLEKQYGLEVIPLPCVPLVSDKQLNSLASRTGFNSYPNISGSYESIASRLFLASLSLLKILEEVRVQQHITVLL